MSNLILDSDVLIDITRDFPPAVNWVATLVTYPSVTGIAAGELLYGAQNAAVLRKLISFLNSYTILWPTEGDVQAAVRTYAPFQLSDGLGFNDAVTAAISIRYGMPLATFNVKHFRSVPGLTIVQPYARI